MNNIPNYQWLTEKVKILQQKVIKVFKIEAYDINI